jgi:transposase InsO family protein
MSIQGPYWARAVEVSRHHPRAIAARDIPASPGVYIWFRDGEPIYVGEAKGAKGLKGRVRAHLATGIDLSRSTLRASVAVAELGVTRAFARQRPSVMTADQITHVNDWLSGCELGWHERATPASAHELEVNLRNEWTPPLNIL